MLHDDWEIYGDGTGNPDDLMFDPLKRILDICDEYGARYTIFAEIGQQLSMLNAPAGSPWAKVANKWESMVCEAIKRGHDVQLHFHPQWIDAQLEKNSWVLNYEKWHTGKISQPELNEWLGNGKKYLESLLGTYNQNYQVVCFRAGGWLCQPSRILYQALRHNQIVCDATVMNGRHIEYKDGSWVDFRDSISNVNNWEVDPDNFSRQSSDSGVWELPVYTEVSNLPMPLYLLSRAFNPLYYYRINRSRKFRRGGFEYSPEISFRSSEKEYYGSFGYMHYNHLLKYVRDLKLMKKTNTRINHLIFMTHSKSFIGYSNFKTLLSKIRDDQEIEFSTTLDYIKREFLDQ